MLLAAVRSETDRLRASVAEIEAELELGAEMQMEISLRYVAMDPTNRNLDPNPNPISPW